jgi:hypothetical protein
MCMAIGKMVGITARVAATLGSLALVTGCGGDDTALVAAQACKAYVTSTQPNSQLTELPVEELVETAKAESKSVWLLTGQVTFDKGFASEQQVSLLYRVEIPDAGAAKVLVVPYGI